MHKRQRAHTHTYIIYIKYKWTKGQVLAESSPRPALNVIGLSKLDPTLLSGFRTRKEVLVFASFSGLGPVVKRLD